MKINIQLRVSVADEDNNLVLEVKKENRYQKECVSKDDVYCDLFDLIGQLQYDIVETSGHSIDFFL